MKCALDTRTKFVPYTIIFKLVPKFKLLHQSEVTVAQGTLLTRMDVLRTARAKLSATKIRIVDDLTQEDLREKNRVRPFMDELYKRQQRPSFRNGRLYADGKEVVLDVINAFLNHSGPV